MAEKTFSLPPRLKSKILIDQLFNSKDSKTVTVFPLRAIYRQIEPNGDDAPIQVMFSVSKRHFKRAVKRNRIKRQMREAFRLNQFILRKTTLHIAFIWLTDSVMPSPRVEKAMVKLLGKVAPSHPGEDEQ